MRELKHAWKTPTVEWQESDQPVVFFPETCSFYDCIRGNNNILGPGSCWTHSGDLGLSSFLSHPIRGIAIARLQLLSSYRRFVDLYSSERTRMYQFRREDTALHAARLLAVYEREPILVMVRGIMDLFTIGPTNNAAVHEAGRHMATVYRSGHIDHMGLA